MLSEHWAQHPSDALALYRGLDALPRTHRDLFRVAGLRVLVLERAGHSADFERVLRSRPHLAANRSAIDFVSGAVASNASSTRVREALAAGRSIAGMVPAAVAAILDREGLYRQ
ncbi:MAG: hypothetical protein HY909_11885 [Deltaproteobacteria bacterium]|nr:hypothetical protein [Deltaproteobacteria bacterium]